MREIAVIVIGNCTRSFDKEYHYLIPDILIDKIEIGIRVIVPFGKGNKKVEGYVFEILNIEDLSCINELKEISEIIDEEPLLSKDFIELAKWMKHRYICTYGEVLKCMIPPGTGVKTAMVLRKVKEGFDLKGNLLKVMEKIQEFGGEIEYDELKNHISSQNLLKYIRELEHSGYIHIEDKLLTRVREKFIRVAYIAKPYEEIIEIIESKVKNIKHIRILEMLLENEYIGVGDIARFAGVSGSMVKTLEKYGYIATKDIQIMRDPYKGRFIEPTKPLQPTVEQEKVLGKLKELADIGKFKEVLLHGVTGSGKTEVYLQIIGYILEKDKKSIMLVPEISLTPQMVERFKGRFGNEVAVLHSRLSPGERHDQWKLIKSGKIKVVVGARSAVFAPLNNLGIIIVDEEHENSYKSELTPKYHAIDVARKRCILADSVLLSGSATPSVETFYRAASDKIIYLKMDRRANKMVLPEVQIVDMRNELNEGNRSVFSKKLGEEIGKNISLGQQTIIFLNRRGYSSFVLCRSCGYTLMCPKCNVSLTYHSNDNRLICHYCGFTVKNPDTCPKCKSKSIRGFGTGTQKIEEEIKKQFENSSVVRMDIDTTTYKNSHEDILTKFREENVNVMVGTQMIAKGHDFPNVTLVGVIAADSMLNTGDYKATERTFQLLTQVAGRAGRGEISGRVVIQTYNTESYSIITACNQDYISFYKQEIMMRERLNYPPYINIGIIMLSGINDRMVYSEAMTIRKKLDYLFSGEKVQILNPARAPITKINSKYRWRIVIKCNNLDKLVEVFTNVVDENLKNQKKYITLSVDINPVSML